MMTNQQTQLPNILVFEDDSLMHQCWDMCAVDSQKIDTLHKFYSWEEFEKQGNANLAKDAVAFVDFDFNKVKSSFNGVDIAKRLKGLGVKKLYSITGNPNYLAGNSHLFDDILGKEIPSDIRAYVA